MNTELLAISVDDLLGARNAVEMLGLDFPVLYDPDANVVKAYGVFNLHANDLPTPSAFIIDTEGNILWEYIGKTASSDRPPNDAIIAQLRKLS